MTRLYRLDPFHAVDCGYHGKQGPGDVPSCGGSEAAVVSSSMVGKAFGQMLAAGFPNSAEAASGRKR